MARLWRSTGFKVALLALVLAFGFLARAGSGSG